MKIMLCRQTGELTRFPSIDKPWLKYYTNEEITSKLTSKCMFEYLFDSNADNLDLTALLYFGREITYRELFSNIKKTAVALSGLGIKKGDVVSFCTVTVPEVIYAFYALNMIGAVGNMIDPRTSVDGTLSYIEESKSNYLVILDALLSRFESLTERESIQKIIVLSPADSMPLYKRTAYKIVKRYKTINDRFITWRKLLQTGEGKTFEPRQYEKDLPVSIMHTGGTTGNPKGVLFSDDSYNHLNDQFNSYNMQPLRGETVLNIMPPFIAYGMAVGIHEFLCCGCKVVVVPVFDPQKFDKLIKKFKPQHFWGVPTHLDNLRFSQIVKRMDLSFLKTAGVGGDAIKIDSESLLGDSLKDHGCHYGVTKGYGMTEVNSAVCVSGEGYNKIGSVGIPLVHVVIAAFVPGTQEELPYGKRGEICIQTPSRMLGYIDRDEENKKVMQIHPDGKLWIHSGDLGYVSEDGFVYIVDRIKRMIIREDGFKVYPSVIENTICECSNVTNCAVVGVHSRSYSQGLDPVAFVTVAHENNAEQTIKDIQLICKEKLAEYQMPIDIRIIDELPLTKVGKVDYLVLEKLAEEQING